MGGAATARGYVFGIKMGAGRDRRRVLLGVLAFFLAAKLTRRRWQSMLDGWHRSRMRAQLALVYRDAGFEPPASKDTAMSFRGWMREFRSYIAWRGPEYGGDALYANARRVFVGFFTPAGCAALRWLAAHFPATTIFFFNWTGNLSMRWIMDCDLERDEGDPTGATLLVRECGFRRELGEDACRRYCKAPTERFLREELGVATTLTPGEGLCCRLRTDRKLDW